MNTNRRTFLLNSAKAGALFLSMPLFSSCGGVARGDLNVETNMTEFDNIIGKDGLEILRLASLAPNGHNAQPWTVKILEPTRWSIGLDPARRLPAVDPDNRELLLSIGAFLENLVMAAESFGYAVKSEIIAQSAQETEILRVTLSKATQAKRTPESIRRRRTVRKGLLSRKISSADLAAVTGHGSGRFNYFAPDSPQGKYLAEATLEANRIQVYRDPAQEELADWIRWSNRDARRHRDGLTPASMEIGGFAGWYVRTFYDRSAVLSKGFRETTLKQVAEQVSAGGGWLVMSAASDTSSSIPALLECGRQFQRMSLKACERSIGVHPMSQILEERPWRDQIAQELGLNDTLQFILRVGYLKSYPKPASLRRPVSRFIRS